MKKSDVFPSDHYNSSDVKSGPICRDPETGAIDA